MARIIRIKNASGSVNTWVGQTIAVGAYHDLTDAEATRWTENATVFSSVADGDLVVNDGPGDFSDATKGWAWLLGDTLPKSDLGNMIAVHPSTKPKDGTKDFYLVWTGCGDDVVNHVIGEGELLAFDIQTTDTEVSKDVRFDPQFGDVYIHEGYAKWDRSADSGVGDYMSALVIASATLLQTSVNLDYEITDNWVKLAAGGPGTGTHGFAASPTLIPRSFAHDGDWDYDGVSLAPNTTGDGEYKISDIDRTVHKYINRIPMCFSSNGYDRLTSDESAYLPHGYFIRVTAFNPSGTAWNCAFMFEVYREKTA